MKFESLKAGQRFNFNGSTWQKRQDHLGADLIGRDGSSISFICGRRSIKEFAPDEIVKVV